MFRKLFKRAPADGSHEQEQFAAIRDMMAEMAPQFRDVIQDMTLDDVRKAEPVDYSHLLPSLRDQAIRFGYDPSKPPVSEMSAEELMAWLPGLQADYIFPTPSHDPLDEHFYWGEQLRQLRKGWWDKDTDLTQSILDAALAQIALAEQAAHRFRTSPDWADRSHLPSHPGYETAIWIHALVDRPDDARALAAKAAAEGWGGMDWQRHAEVEILRGEAERIKRSRPKSKRTDREKQIDGEIAALDGDV